MTAVIKRPTRTPRIGFWNAVNRLVKAGSSASGFTAPLISFMPYIRTANPIRMLPMSFFFCFLEAMIRRIPIKANTREKFSGFSSLIKALSDSTPTRVKIQAVMVVPMLEPMMTPIVWLIDIIPEFTRPTSITVTAEDD